MSKESQLALSVLLNAALMVFVISLWGIRSEYMSVRRELISMTRAYDETVEQRNACQQTILRMHEINEGTLQMLKEIRGK